VTRKAVPAPGCTRKPAEVPYEENETSMTPDTNPDQHPGVTPGKGVRIAEAGEPAEIDLARRRREYALAERHPARLGLPTQRPVPRTLSDEEIEEGARIVGMVDRAPKHREGPPIRKRDAARAALRRIVLGDAR
jgi:hypothetical protein